MILSKPQPQVSNATQQVFMKIYRLIGLVGRVLVNGPGDPGFDPRSSHTEDLKMVLDTSLLNTHHYKVRIKGKVEQYRERSCALPYTSV